MFGLRSLVRITKEHPELKLLLALAGAFTFVLSAKPRLEKASISRWGDGFTTDIIRRTYCLSRSLAQTLATIHGEGTTILMATHDLEWVYRWADWLFVMDRSKLILEGTPKDIFAQQELLERIKLGVPLGFQISSLLDEVNQSIAILFGL